MPHTRTLAAVCALLSSLSAAGRASADADTEMNALFGADLRRVAATADGKDDAELAALMVKSVDEAASRSALKVQILRKSAELGVRDPVGYDAAELAARRLLDLAPDQAPTWRAMLLDVYRKRFAVARGDARREAGRAYLSQLARAGEAALAQDKAEEASRHYRAALTLAMSLRSPNRRALAARLKSVAALQAAQRRADALRSRLEKNPADTTAREALILYHLLVRNNPAEATKLLTDDVAEHLRTYVPMATRGVENVPKQGWLELGAWYESLAAKATTPEARRTALVRACGYYQCGGALHETDNVMRVKAMLSAGRVRKGLDKLGACLSPDAFPGGGMLTLQLPRGVKMELVLVPAGEFVMGSATTTRTRRDPSRLTHVTILAPFYIGRTEVTQAQYYAATGLKRPKGYRGEDPMAGVKWNQALDFCARASRLTGRTVRLPSQAEWDYAYRAGSRATSHAGKEKPKMEDHAWGRYNSGGKPQQVATRRPNPWGLYDVWGNVYEFCTAGYGANAKGKGPGYRAPSTDYTRMAMGGSYLDPYFYPHSPACRRSDDNFRYPDIGFRVVVDFAGAVQTSKTPIAQPDPAEGPKGDQGDKIVLRAEDAILHGKRIRKETKDGKNENIGAWLLPTDRAVWETTFPKPGTYEVFARVAALAEADFQIKVGQSSLAARSCATGDYDTFKTIRLGVIRVKKAGKQTVEVRPLRMNWKPMNVAFLELRPTTK